MTKIAIPSDDQTTIAPHFGRTAGFVVFHYDESGLRPEYRQLSAAPSAGCCEGDGPSRHDRIIAAIGDCDVVIAGGMGDHMMSTLYAAGVDVVFTTEPDVRRAAELLVTELLPVESGSGCCQH